MELILNRPGMMHTFSTEWKLKWVPAILGYCRTLKKKDVSEVLSSHNILSGEHTKIKYYTYYYSYVCR